ncbi:MAG TPA: gliding motility lipoprotein GldD [Bacteroidales bacterium]|jgi:gliding motility-associated lipoprotein GldD|nr:gliding motility lipoprotein GldD [Bacteroidales bacterium]HRT13681.1 gliding motility lipoprotein GldD [Bacteroidales bacterium]
MNKYLLIKISFITLILFFLNSCIKKEEAYTPKPKGYFRIELPPHAYQTLDTTLPFTFQYSQYATYHFSQKENGDYWLYLNYPKLNAEINFTYSKLAGDLRQRIIEEDKILSFHYQVADNIEYSIISDPTYQIYGQLYDIEGISVATPLSFWLSDSVSHFLRGTLYFNNPPNNDSLQPVIQYIREDMLKLISSFKWE